jgi:predicted AlkP superfamily pyrophosphatase or phosphodiesterase
MKIYSILFLFLFLTGNVNTQARPGYAPDQKRPGIVIGLVIENMRPDYILRYWNKFEPGGFKKLYSEGAVCTNVNMTQYYQSYASGTATLFTGVHPSMHGIIGKTWYDRLRSREMECTEDDYYITVGADTKSGNASPRKLLSHTLTDNLKIFSKGKSLVYSAAMNRESAIFAAGHAADGAFWFDTESGRMVSSSFYINTFPDWVRDFNLENYSARFSSQNWITLLPAEQYSESIEDDYLLEKGYFDKWNTFPHNLRRYTKEAESYKPLITTPYSHLILKNFALELLENEPMGEDDQTDFFTLIFSSMDYENGSFGPASLEMQDSYLYLDKYIAELITYCEKKFGKEQVLFFLTANTSASYPVNYLKEEFHFPVDHFSPGNAVALLTSYLNITYGEENWIEHYSDLQVYLNHDAIKKHKIDLNEIRAETSNFINQFEGVHISLPADQLEKGFSDNGLIGTLYKSYAKNRSGDFLYLLKEGWQPSYKFKKVNYTDQLHIPMVFYGAGIQPQTIREQYNAIDLAPTLSILLQIPGPDKSLGRAIHQVITGMSPK